MMGELSHCKTDTTTCFSHFKIRRGKEGEEEEEISYWLDQQCGTAQDGFHSLECRGFIQAGGFNLGAGGEKRNRTHHSMNKSAPAIAKELWCSVSVFSLQTAFPFNYPN